MDTGDRRARRGFQAIMGAAFGLAVLPTVAVLLFSGALFGLGRVVVFLGLAGALLYTGSEWARWGLSLWFGLAGLLYLLAAFVGAVLSTGPALASVAPLILVGMAYLAFATVFARSSALKGGQNARRQRARGRVAGP